jgi:hypothetical protein
LNEVPLYGRSVRAYLPLEGYRGTPLIRTPPPP